MTVQRQSDAVGLLLSGGLDSAILLGHLLAAGRRVQPFYIRSHLHWEAAEERAARRFVAAMRHDRSSELVTLDMPVADLYHDHWSVTGRGAPGAATPDEAVYLPGRNALLIVKAALWCQMHDVGELALAPLASNPFADATDSFFDALETTLSLASEKAIKIQRPFGQLTKRDVMLLGRDMPLELTFSCLAPVGMEHCGECNKCAERQAAFRAAALPDPTRYASSIPATDFPATTTDVADPIG